MRAENLGQFVATMVLYEAIISTISPISVTSLALPAGIPKLPGSLGLSTPLRLF
jgi:hypothetical protein